MSQTDQLAINRIAQSLEDIAKNGGGSGGDTVSITPTLEEGTKIAEFSINGQHGSLYAPQGGGGGGWRTLAETTVNYDDTDEEKLTKLNSLANAISEISFEDFQHTRLLIVSGSSDTPYFQIFAPLYAWEEEGYTEFAYGLNTVDTNGQIGKNCILALADDTPTFSAVLTSIMLNNVQALVLDSQKYPDSSFAIYPIIGIYDSGDTAHVSIVTDLS